MSLKPKPDAVAASRTLKKEPILVLSAQADVLAGALQRIDASRSVSSAQTINQVLEQVNEHSFGYLLIDNRDDGAMALLVPRLSALGLFKIVVLAGPNNSASLHSVPGEIEVVDSPYHAKTLAIALGYETDRRSKDRPFAKKPSNPNPIKADELETETQKQSNAPQAASSNPEPLPREELNQETLSPPPAANTQVPIQETKVDNAVNAANFVGRFVRTLFNLVPGLTPILSTIYKHLALTILASLLVAFVSYGIMIGYFLTASDWASPLQLSQGHTLVEKAGRDLTDMEVRANYLSQQVSTIDRKIQEAEDVQSQAGALTDFVMGTIESEISTREAKITELDSLMDSLSEVLREYGSQKDRQRRQASLRREYKNRLITRDSFDRARLNHISIERDIAKMFAQLTQTQMEHQRTQQSITYLRELEESLKSGSKIVNRLGGADLVPLNNQIMEIKQLLATSASVLNSADTERDPLVDSLTHLRNSIRDLRASPMIRAAEKPVSVLFVPYENIQNFKPGQPLYKCVLQIAWCTKIGETKNKLPGEFDIDHPLFGKPVRGQFVEATLSDPEAVQESILHVGRPPLFF